MEVRMDDVHGFGPDPQVEKFITMARSMIT